MEACLQPPLFWVCLKIFFFFFSLNQKSAYIFFHHVTDSEVVVFGTVAEILENLAFLANASNLVLYLKQHMHMSPSKSANNVTNFMGTAFLLALLGGFLSDAFFTTYRVYLISAVIEFMVSHHITTLFHVIAFFSFSLSLSLSLSLSVIFSLYFQHKPVAETHPCFLHLLFSLFHVMSLKEKGKSNFCVCLFLIHMINK